MSNELIQFLKGFGLGVILFIVLAVLSLIAFFMAVNFVEAVQFNRNSPSDLVGVTGLVVASIVSIAAVLVPYLWITVVMFRRGNTWMGFGLLIALLLTPLTLGTACFAILTDMSFS